MHQPEKPAANSIQYQQAMQFLDRRVDFERFHVMPGLHCDFKLDRMREFLDRLGNPQDKLPVIHVAGTKGKGSTSAMIAAVLRSAGYRTGLFTSPHLEKLEERIAVDGIPCTADRFAALVAEVRPAVEALDQESLTEAGPICRSGPEGPTNKLALSPFYGPTYFEIITAMALVHFVRLGVQAAVLEVGLGGRLDSTNVCRPRVSVITSISFDHVRQLGNSLESIAREKAGIIKPGVPVISGVTAEGPREVIRRIARDRACRLTELDVDFRFDYQPPLHLEKDDTLGTVLFIDKKAESPFSVQLALLGRHQAANAAVALATIHELNRQGWSISEESIRQGLATVQWPARIEILSRRPVVILDTAHNTASIAALMETLSESFSVSRRLLVFAATRDKDFQEMLKLLLDGFDEIVFTRYTTNPRAMPPAELESAAFQLSGRHYPVCNNPAEAWNRLRPTASPDDLLCITGSFFLAGEMRRLLNANM
jgi:dihydrofolate synthase/folylpolyglutamate synthase